MLSINCYGDVSNSQHFKQNNFASTIDNAGNYICKVVQSIFKNSFLTPYSTPNQLFYQVAIDKERFFKDLQIEQEEKVRLSSLPPLSYSKGLPEQKNQINITFFKIVPFLILSMADLLGCSLKKTAGMLNSQVKTNQNKVKTLSEAQLKKEYLLQLRTSVSQLSHILGCTSKKDFNLKDFVCNFKESGDCNLKTMAVYEMLEISTTITTFFKDQDFAKLNNLAGPSRDIDKAPADLYRSFAQYTLTLGNFFSLKHNMNSLYRNECDGDYISAIGPRENFVNYAPQFIEKIEEDIKELEITIKQFV